MQQVNLFLREFRPSREPLRAVHMAWGLLGVFIMLLAVSGYTHFQYTKLVQKSVLAQKAQDALLLQMQALTVQKPVQSGADLDTKIQQLQNELQRRQQIAVMISSQNLGNDKGFSQQLTVLAKTALNTISIETFSLQGGGSYAEFSGKARSADQILLYLQKLRANASFAGVGFGVLKVERDEKLNNSLQFSLAKATDDKTKKEHTGGNP